MFSSILKMTEERKKTKEKKNYRYNSVPREIRLKLLFAQLFLFYQFCVYEAISYEWRGLQNLSNKNGETWERGDLCWLETLTHCWLIKTPSFSIEILTQEKLLRSTKSEWKSFHNQIVCQRFVLMQDPWKHVKSDSTSWQSTLTSPHNLQHQWHVVITCLHEMKNKLIRNVGFEWTQI